jgi:hypothetical protein
MMTDQYPQEIAVENTLGRHYSAFSRPAPPPSLKINDLRHAEFQNRGRIGEAGLADSALPPRFCAAQVVDFAGVAVP